MFFNYICKKCNEEHTIFQNTYDDIKPPCEKCGTIMERAVGSTTFHLKGNGFHATDYKDKK